jgi:type IV secretion system protein VirB2
MCCVIFEVPGVVMTDLQTPTSHRRRTYAYSFAVAVLLFVISPIVAAQALPYQDGLETLRVSMTGPIPFIISLVGIVACGAMLIFGGEISGFLRTMVFIVLVVSVIVQGSSLIDLLGGSWVGDPAASVRLPSPAAV